MVSDVPPLRVLVLALGTRGDVQPYVALCRGLIEAGHEAVLGAPSGFRDLAEPHGVPLLPVGDEMLQLMQQAMPQMSGPREAGRLIRQMTAAMKVSLQQQWEAARAFAPTLVVAHPKALGGLHIAEHLDVPFVVSLPLPFLTPTEAFPIPFLTRTLSGRVNRWTYQLNRFPAVAYGAMINQFRTETLGLRRMSRISSYLVTADGSPVPVLYCYSRHVLPVPTDFPPHAHVTGYWFLDAAEDWTPPGRLARFLDPDPRTRQDPVVYIGFGSMGFGRDAAQRGEQIVRAVHQAGVRAVVARGWGGVDTARDGSPLTSDRVLTIDAAPHSWLFDRVDAVVHHGGAGSTAAGLRASRPSLVCPFLGDQPFWGQRVAQLGAGPEPLPHRALTADRLAERLTALVHEPRYAHRAQELGERLRDEDGVGNAVAALVGIHRDHHAGRGHRRPSGSGRG
ncbi:glycosyltransferase [Auraticoccus monumenti]|uniref:Sterol 3beta-glucosyltransferase n=1 Tax=Auraticoccus monumenti TaxID=675864 RepID=A0A1G6YKY3_9ACTN|nr:glycosyltransferase [Auraticoccus monumenti]SDD90951.1 sterol 3beta-glucosyltransferase [Auraticoccus monumenti]